VRFFKPQQEEEFRVSREARAGQIVGYDHHIEESRCPGASLDRARRPIRSARTISARKLGLDLNAWEVLREEANSKQAGRTVWIGILHGKKARLPRERRAPTVCRSTLQGERIGGQRRVPARSRSMAARSYQQLRSSNLFLQPDRHHSVRSVARQPRCGWASRSPSTGKQVGVGAIKLA